MPPLSVDAVCSENPQRTTKILSQLNCDILATQKTSLLSKARDLSDYSKPFPVTWLTMNITAYIGPFEVNPVFYRWAYALLTDEACTAFTDIRSSESVPDLYCSLKVLFLWWITGLLS